MRAFLSCFMAALLLAPAQSALLAQDSVGALDAEVCQAPTVTLVIARSLPAGVGSLVQRYAGQPAENMIVLSDSASPGQLHASLAILRRSRQVLGDSLANDLRMSIPPVAVTVRDTVSRRALENQLARLRRARADVVDRTGGRRSITIPLEPITRGEQYR